MKLIKLAAIAAACISCGVLGVSLVALIVAYWEIAAKLCAWLTWIGLSVYGGYLLLD